MQARQGHSTAALLLALGLLSAGCRSQRVAAEQEPERDVDRILVGVADPEMRERWRRADEEGTLPPLDSIPVAAPGQAVVDRAQAREEKPARQGIPRRPVLPEGGPGDVQPYCAVPLASYQGALTVTAITQSVLSGRIEGREEELELHLRLPDAKEGLDLAKGARLQLDFRDGVVDSSLQRRIVLGDERGPVLVFLSEGNDGPYRADFEDLDLSIVQGSELGSPPVQVSRAGSTITLERRERGTLGREPDTIEVTVLQSVARTRTATLLSEGRSHYVRVLLYRARR